MASLRMPRPTRTLLFLIRVKRTFLRSQILDLLSDPVNRELIVNPGRNPEISLNPPVQLGTLITHPKNPVFKTMRRLVCPSELGVKKIPLRLRVRVVRTVLRASTRTHTSAKQTGL